MAEKIIFLLLIFSIPFQRRIFLFGPHSPIEDPEKFVEWNSAFFYFTDILMVVLFGSAVLGAIFKVNGSFSETYSGKIKSIKWPMIFLFVFVLASGLSIINAQLADYAIYRYIKLLGYVFVFVYAMTRVDFQSWTGSSFGKGLISLRSVVYAFLVSGIFQSIVALIQFGRQKSAGLSFLHESPIQIGMREVAHLKVALSPISIGQPLGEYMDMIRAYGTFPSPNVLAGFLGICLFFAVCVFISTGLGKIGKQLSLPGLAEERPANWRRILRGYVGEYKNFINAAVILFLFEGFLLSFSRGAAFFLAVMTGVFFAGLFVSRRFRAWKFQIFELGLALALVFGIAGYATLPELSSRFLATYTSEDSLAERSQYNKAGISAVSRDEGSALLGVGIGNFVDDYMKSAPNLKLYLYQPVHNIYLLIASEIGLVGGGAFVLFLLSVVAMSIKALLRKKELELPNALFIYATFAAFTFMLLVGLYDHYFWTLQHGALMFWIVLGLLAGAVNIYKN